MLEPHRVHCMERVWAAGEHLRGISGAGSCCRLRLSSASCLAGSRNPFLLPEKQQVVSLVVGLHCLPGVTFVCAGLRPSGMVREERENDRTLGTGAVPSVIRGMTGGHLFPSSRIC
jgi:hypothetical protein